MDHPRFLARLAVARSVPRSVLGLGLGLMGAAALALWLLQNQREDLSVAITSWPGYEYLYLAEEKRLAERFGLDFRVQQYTSLEDQRHAFERGDIPVMATTLPEAIAVCQSTPARCPVLILVLDQSNGADRLLARAPLNRPEELLGRRVGLERAVLAEYLLLRSFGERPPDLGRDLQLFFDGPVALVEALKRGGVDAIVTYSPHDQALRGDQRFRELFSSRQIPGEVVDVLAVDPAYARRQPSQLQALVRSWWAARDYARRFPGQAQAVMAQRQQMEPEQFAAC